MLEKQLREEIEKWLKRIKEERKNVVLLDKSKSEMLKNIDAYISDCEHFLKKGKLVETFEAVLWAWAYLTILLELKILQKS